MNNFFGKVLRQLTQKNLPSKGEAFPDYFNWLRYSVTGMLIPGNIKCIEYAIKNLPSDAPITEIGSFCGLSACHIDFFKHLFGKTNRFITCDRWIFERSDAEECLLGSEITHAKFQEFIKASYMRNVSMFCREIPNTIEVFSDELFQRWEKAETVVDIFGRSLTLGGGISFAYIDGNHSYDFAKRDLDNVMKHLEIGGFVLMDDSLDYNNLGAERVAQEALRNPQLELVAKNPNYFFRRIA